MGKIIFALMLLAEAWVTSSCLNAAPPNNEEPGAPQQQSPSAPAPGQTTPPAQSPAGGGPSAIEGPTSPTGILGQDLLTGDWGGLRKTLQNDGVTLTPTDITEVFGNASGGIRQGVIADGLLNVALDLDLEKMSGGAVTDLTLHTNAEYLYGPGLSQYDVGDFSNTSNIAGDNTLRLQELWIQKWLLDKRLSVKLGNMAVDTEFFQSATASLFINGTFGAFTFIANNVPNAPVYPLASPGVRMQFLPDSQFYVMTGVYGQDVSSNPATNNQNGTRFALTSSSGMLIMSEAGFLLNQQPNDKGLQGTYRLGSFVHTDDSRHFEGDGSGGTNYGVYGVLDQQLYSRDNRLVSFFVRSGGAPTDTNFVDYYVDSGFNFTGFVAGRNSDVAGVAVARSHVSQDFSNAQLAATGRAFSAETVVEGTYKVQLALWWSVQPDVQFVITPSGQAGSSNAVVLGLRTNLAF